ncbi:MAG: hypothetical protein HYV90_06015 [Candidatus Woesebacteria bacterium]|nr:MAG: hypothetical protein HYV90_06015 [Candidatus Woesebacteria bacterium]
MSDQTWSGNVDELPVMGEPFFYNGSQYYWAPCPCGNLECNRPVAYNASDDEENPELTFRLRGKDNGDPSLDLLFAIGATVDEVWSAHQAMENGDHGQAMSDLLDKYQESALESGLISEGELMARMIAAVMTS